MSGTAGQFVEEGEVVGRDSRAFANLQRDQPDHRVPRGAVRGGRARKQCRDAHVKERIDRQDVAHADVDAAGHAEDEIEQRRNCEAHRHRRNPLAPDRLPHARAQQQERRGQRRHRALHREDHGEVIPPAFVVAHPQQIAGMAAGIVIGHRVKPEQVGVGRKVEPMTQPVQRLAHGIFALCHIRDSRDAGAHAAQGFRPVDHQHHHRRHREQCRRRGRGAPDRELARPADPACDVQNREWRKQQHGREFRDQCQADHHAGSQQSPERALLQVLHPQHAREKEKGGDRKIRGHVASVRDQVGVERAHRRRHQTRGRAVAATRPPGDGQREQERQQDVRSARRDQDGVGMQPVAVQEVHSVLHLIRALALGVERMRGQPHKGQRQRAHDLDQRRVLDVPGVIAQRQVGEARDNVDAFVPRLRLAHRGTHFQRPYNRQYGGHAGPKETSTVHSRPTG